MKKFIEVDLVKSCLWVLMTLLLLLAPSAQALDNCMTLQTEILVHKEKIYDYNGRRVRLICAGNIRINKCEGYCLSQMSPSVVQFPGFKKV